MNDSRMRTNGWWRSAISWIGCLSRRLGLSVRLTFLNTSGSLTVLTRHGLMVTLLARMDSQQISTRSGFVFLCYINLGLH